MSLGPDTLNLHATPAPLAEGWAAVGVGGKIPLAAFTTSVFLHGAMAAGVILGFGGLGEIPPTAQEPIIVELVFMSPTPGKADSGVLAAVERSAAEKETPGPVEPVEAVQAASKKSSKADQAVPAKEPVANKPVTKRPDRQQALATDETKADWKSKQPAKTAPPAPPPATPNGSPEEATQSIETPAVNVVSATVLKGPRNLNEGVSTESGAGFISPKFQLGSANNPIPRYPRQARRRGMEGRVVLRVTVSADGSPSKITVLESSGYAILDRAAVRTFRDWRFSPAFRAGIPVISSLDVPISFRLRD